MVTVTEGTVDVEGKALFTKSWLPDGPPKAKVVFVHGFSDHVDRYYGFFPALASRGIAVHGFDQRGWGRSVAKPSERGLTGPTKRVVADVAAVVAPHLPADPAEDAPCFVMGHSMGGGTILALAADPAHAALVSRVRGWLLESPFIGFAPEAEPSPLLVFAGRLAALVLPRLHMRQELRAQDMSRDPAVAESISADPLCHNTGTLSGLASLLDRTAALTQGVLRPGPGVRALWVGHGTADKVTSFALSKRYFDEYTTAVPDRTFRTYEGWYHQLHADGPDRDIFYREVGDWILARCDHDDAQEEPERQGKSAGIGPKL